VFDRNGGGAGAHGKLAGNHFAAKCRELPTEIGGGGLRVKLPVK
jgi:hypothetical protein